MIRIPRPTFAALVAAGVLVSGGCGGGGGGAPTGPKIPGGPGQVVEIHLTSGLQFSPSSVTVQPGTTVRWIDDAAMGHTITPDNPSQAGAWNSASVNAAGATFENTFTVTGTFYYHCVTHQAQGMTGVVIVQADNSPPPPGY